MHRAQVLTGEAAPSEGTGKETKAYEAPGKGRGGRTKESFYCGNSGCVRLKGKDTNDPYHSGSNYSSSEKRQSLIYCLAKPHYGSLINADGHAEVWTDWNETAKFFQYGWRCTTNEDAYSIHTLMGNWNQDRFDIKYIVQPKSLPSQFGHYFETTYDASYNSHVPLPTHRYIRGPHWFPGHQPELEPPRYKCTDKSIYHNSYVDPQFWNQFYSPVCELENYSPEGQGF